MSARFRIKIDVGRRTPFVLKDRQAPAYLRSFRTLRAAMLHIDNRVRGERGMPPRPDIERADVVEAMKPEHHGQHVQGCVSCYEYVEATRGCEATA
jgi:hypothetical protein